jgi:GT2 family glycosyltransferase
MTGSRTLRTEASFPPQRHLAHVESSRQAIVDAIGNAPDLTFVRGVGNWGDELIFEGIRRLLRGRPYREIGIDDIARSRGHSAIIAGGGAFCRPYHETMPHVLAVADLRFERVIVLPTSFDVSVDCVKEALSKTRATVFAREELSYRAIRGFCDARLALDCAFFFDFSPYYSSGTGTLVAYRTDLESNGEPLPPGNEDVSLTCGSLDEWLRTIARHSRVRTDRAHVMIASALLGKDVEAAPSSYHKVAAIADYSLGGFPVQVLARTDGTTTYPASVALSGVAQELTEARETGTSSPGPRATRATVTIIVLSHDRIELTSRCLRSLRTSVDLPYRLVVIDNNSSPPARARLRALQVDWNGMELYLLDRNLGCAGGRKFAVERADTDYVMFLDDDAEVFPSTVERLVEMLEQHPEATAVTAKVIGPSGVLQHCGADYEEDDGLAVFRLRSNGLLPNDPTIGPSGPCDWVPGTAKVVRRAAFDQFPLDLGMARYYEDNEWCFRVNRLVPGSFLRCVEAPVLHHGGDFTLPRGTTLAALAERLPFLAALSHFYRLYGLVHPDVFHLAPELQGEERASRLQAARIFLDLLRAMGTDWMLMSWLSGDLSPIFASARAPHSTVERLRENVERLTAELELIQGSRLWRLGSIYYTARVKLRRLFARSARLDR